MTRRARRPSITFERAALGGSIAFVAYLVSRYDICFQDAEVLTGYMFDDGERARLLDYAANILTLETRLMLWKILPPHPSFTPVWVLTLLAGPVLLYRFLHIELGSRPAALAGVAVYLVSTGCLSGVTMLFHQAKALANVAVIATLYFSSRINTAVQAQSAEGSAPHPPRALWIGLLTLLAAAPFTDEAAAFAFAIPVVWCPALFWTRHPARIPRPCLRSWVAYAIPAALVVMGLLLILPSVFAAAGRNLELLEFLQRKATEGAPHGKLDVRHMVWQAGNLSTPGLLPWRVAGVRTPVADSPVLPGVALAGVAAALLVATVSIRRRQVYWVPYRKLLVLASIFVVFQGVVLVFHPLELSATGFYYGAIFSVLFASLIAVVFADASDRPGGRTPARLGLAWVLVISAVNVQAINASWIAHSDFKALANLPTLAVYGHGADTTHLAVHAARHQQSLDSLPDGAAEAMYSTDAAGLGPGILFRNALSMWSRWRRGDANFLAGRPLTLRDLWIAVELDMNTRTTPRRWRTLLPWH